MNSSDDFICIMSSAVATSCSLFTFVANFKSKQKMSNITFCARAKSYVVQNVFDKTV